MRKRLVFFATGLLLLAAGYLAAQGPIFKPPKSPEITILSTPAVAKDGQKVEQLGFRVSGIHANKAHGTLMAKVNGNWVEVELDSHNAFAGH